ncbi:WD repeat-containing protein 24, partial [Clonorchis sinensis]
IPRAKSTSRLFVSSNDSVVNGLDHNSSLGSPLTTQSSQVSCPRAHSVTDVTWSCADNVLATGSSNGAITLWEVGSVITQLKSFCGHLRSIHCLMFHPTNPWELLTASQDGKLNLFDTREPNPGTSPRTFIQRAAVPSPVRDVTYCPRNSYLFAAAQENGTLSIWDTRQSGRPYLAFQGHSCSIASLDWLPNWPGISRNWLATAGAVDHLIKVWNFSQLPSGQSACPPVVYTVRTSNVSRVRWRPGVPTQLVSSCNQTFDLSAYLWDLKRPYLPYAAFEEHKSIVTSISWCPAETDYFYTVGRDGLLIRHCVADGVRPAESASPVALAFSPRGNLAHAVSRDRVLAVQPPPVVDETNVVTQSIYYPPRRTHSNLLNSTTVSTLTPTDAPPGFYAAPSASASSDQLGLANLPEMGSTRSAELFISQAQSLLFCFEPSFESLVHADWINAGNALVPDLIMALAKHYRFVGPSVDWVCRHNATVALRFGQSFLVQFWSMLRAIYGTTTNFAGRRKTASLRSSSGPSAAKPSENVAGSQNPAAIGSQTQKSSNVRSSSRKPCEPTETTGNPLVVHGASVNTSEHRSVKPGNVFLTDVLRAVGIRPGSLESTVGRTTSVGVNQHAEGNDFDEGWQPDAVGSEACVPVSPDQRDRYPSSSRFASDLHIPSNKNTLSQPEQVMGSQELELTAVVSNTIPIRNRGTSISKASRSPGSSHLLGMSASSAHTCDSLGEPVDFLFHYPPHVPLQDPSILDGPCNGQQLPHSAHLSSGVNLVGVEHHGSSFTFYIVMAICPSNFHLFSSSHLESGSYLFLPTLCDLVNRCNIFLPSSTRGEKEPSYMHEICEPDDPVPLDGGYIPDEAFHVRHPFERHLQVSLEPRDEDTASKRATEEEAEKEVGTRYDTSIPTKSKTHTNFPGPHSAGDLAKDDISIRIAKARAAFVNLHHLWRRRGISLSVKRPVYNPSVRSVSLYESETWPLHAEDVKRLSTFDHRYPRSIARVWWEHQVSNAQVRLMVFARTHPPMINEFTLHRLFVVHIVASILSSHFSEGVHKDNIDSTIVNEPRVNKPVTDAHPDTGVHLLAPFNSALGPSPRHAAELGTLQLPDASSLVVQWLYELVEAGHVQTVCTALLALGSERLRITEWITEARISSWFMAYLELLSRFRLWTVCARIIKQCGSSKGGVDSVHVQKDLRRVMAMQPAIRPLCRLNTETESDTYKSTTTGPSDSKQESSIRTRWKSGSTGGATSLLNSTSVSALAPDVSSANQTSTTLSIHCGRCSKRFVATEATQLATGHAGWACSRHASTADAINATCALCHQTVRGLFVWCRGCSHGGHLEHMQVSAH